MNVLAVVVLVGLAGVLVMPVAAESTYYPSSPSNLPDLVKSWFGEWFKGAVGDKGIQGLNNMTPNMTPNMTASNLDTTGFLFHNGTRAMTGNLLAGGYNISNVKDPVAAQDAVTLNKLGTYVGNNSINASYGDHGALTGLTDDDHVRYFDKDTSKSFTGGALKRDVANSYLAIYGGSSVASGAGSWFYLTGKDHPSTAGFFGLYVPNAAKNADVNILRVYGATDTPELSLQSHKIVDVLDPTAAQDAATRNYVLHPDLTASAQLNAVCYNTGTKLVTYNSGLTTCLASTEKVKENIIPVSESLLPKLNELKPVYYTSKLDNQIHYGLIGEDIVKVFPELVAHDEGGNISGVRYEEFTSVLLKGMQEQQAIIEKQDERIRALEKKVGL